MLRYLTAGETHGKGLVAILEGMPSGVGIDTDKINGVLSRRQRGYGRGDRMKIENDKINILSGIKNGYTTAAPIAFIIENKDYDNWKDALDGEKSEGCIYTPRPGHADLSGGIKYGFEDLRAVSERASARETAARVAVGAITEQFLAQFKILPYTRCVSIGNVFDESRCFDDEFYKRAVLSPVGFGNPESEKKAIKHLEDAISKGESVGGIVETVFKNVPPGLGSYVHYDRKLDANIAFSAMSIQGIKGVEIGMGFESGGLPGSMVHDEISYGSGYVRATNNAGGIEGGMSNGEPITVRAAMKPIPTMKNPLNTVNIKTKKEEKAVVERADVCAVYACSVVLETCVSFEITKAFLEKFGCDNMKEIKNAYDFYIDAVKNY